MKKAVWLLIGWAVVLAACEGGRASATATVYFLNTDRYAIGTEPYEDPVTRTVPATGSRPEAVLRQLFAGPSAEEKAKGLGLVLSGTTGLREMTLQDGVARIYLEGTCNAKGATYTIANLIFANLAQFPEIKAVKIYDENGQTERPDGLTDSIPLCLEP